MFNRTADQRRGESAGLPAVVAERRAAPPAHAQSVIGRGVEVGGSLAGDGELQVDGKIRGEVRTQRLTVGEGGLVDGDVTADSVQLHGQLRGTVIARSVRLAPSAQLHGDVTCEELAIELGAVFEGRAQRPVGVAPRAAPADAYAPPFTDPIQAQDLADIQAADAQTDRRRA